MIYVWMALDGLIGGIAGSLIATGYLDEKKRPVQWGVFLWAAWFLLIIIRKVFWG